MSIIYGNSTEFHLYMVLIMGLLSQWTLQRISTRSSELNRNFLLCTTPRCRDRLKITTSGWKRTFRCSVHIDRMIGQICFQQWNLPTIITTTHWSIQPPFFVNYGYHPTLMNVPSAGQSGESDEQICWIHNTQEECKCAIEWSQEISKQAYNKWKNKNPGFKVGDLVWLEATNLSTDEPSPKLVSKWHGPFKIKDKLSDLTYHLELPAHWRIHDVFHVNVLLEAKTDTIPQCWQPAPPVKVKDEDFWVMEKYVNAWWFWNHFQFKIQWDGFSEEHNTWEDADSIDSDNGPWVLGEDDFDFDLEEDFYHRHPDTPKRTDPPAAQRQPARWQRTCH